MNYRTETQICVGCGLEIRYKLRVSNPKWRGSFRQAIGARSCPRCVTIAQLAEEGDELCKATVEARSGAYA
jgi:hypothetical protein